MNTSQLVEIGQATHPRDGATGMLYRHTRTGAYTLRVGSAHRSFPPSVGAQIEFGKTGSPAAGRPPAAGEAMKPHTVYLTDAQWQWVQAHGLDALRHLIDHECERKE